MATSQRLDLLSIPRDHVGAFLRDSPAKRRSCTLPIPVAEEVAGSTETKPCRVQPLNLHRSTQDEMEARVSSLV